jgi:outer membrane protein assembly factor BamB
MVSRCLLLGAMLAVSCLPAGADDWPQFRGPGRDNKVTGFAAPATWPKELKQEWKVPAGDGVASPILLGNRVYVFVREGDEEALRCLDATTGKEIWKEKYKEEEVTSPGRGFPGQEPFSGPRATPAAGEGKICTLGAGGTVSCFDAATGKVLWRHLHVVLASHRGRQVHRPYRRTSRGYEGIWRRRKGWREGRPDCL